MPFIAGWPEFHITEETAEKLKTISAETEGEKPGQTLGFPEKPYPEHAPSPPVRSGKRLGFRQIDTDRLESATTTDRPHTASMFSP
jgi:hypothetical protein